MPIRHPVGRLHPARHIDRIDSLIEMLCRAFDQDAHINWIVRQDERRAEAFRRLFRLLLTELAPGHGELFASADLQAGALWFPPGAWKLGLPSQLRVGLRFAAICGWHNLPLRAYGLNRMEARHPKTPHYFLQTIGVAPEKRRQGHGSALLETLFARSDAAGVPVYLETSRTDNVAFYERHGFQVIGRVALPRGPMLFQMLRPARRPAHP